MKYPDRFADVAHLEEVMSTPSDELVCELATVPGDIMVLGVGGKMGPTLARMAKRAAPLGMRVIGVARFSEPGLRQALDRYGVETVAADLLDRAALERLPKAPNVVFMAGRKFGATGDVPLTWAMNVQVPAMVAEVKGYTERYVECVTSRGLPEALIDRFTGAPTVVSDPWTSRPWERNWYYPSTAMHEEAADLLEPVCRAMLVAGRPAAAGQALAAGR